MIISNGIDIIDIRRIKKTIDKYNFRFKKKVFSSW
jgi:phosphopantetheinyl transferase (holo-ACP synthase)